jgi:outer membrane lipoprotein LolB
MKTSKLITLALLIALIFSACNGNHKVKTKTLKHWSQVNHWSITGKMAINGGRNSGSGRIKWRVEDNKLTAEFKAPLGQANWKIIETTTQAKLTSSINGESFADTAQILISHELGWEFPWSELNYWLRGYPYKHELTQHNNPPDSINEKGWNIEIHKWTNTPIGMLPKKITASKPPYKVKIIIYDWEIISQ